MTKKNIPLNYLILIKTLSSNDSYLLLSHSAILYIIYFILNVLLCYFKGENIQIKLFRTIKISKRQYLFTYVRRYLIVLLFKQFLLLLKIP